MWLIAVALLAVFLIPFDPVRDQLDRFAGDGSADLFTPEVHWRFRMGSVAAALLAGGAAFVLVRRRARLAERLRLVGERLGKDRRQLVRNVIRLVQRHRGWLLAVTVLAAAIRIPYLDQPMRYDESHTFVKYASMPSFLIVTRYDEPNNHILHSLAVRASTRLLGDDAWVIRLPALVCGILLVPVTLLWGSVVAGRLAGIAAGLLVAIHSNLVEFSVNARGYTMAALLFAIACIGARDVLRRGNLLSWILTTGAMVLCLWTLPTMVYGLVGLGTWMVLESAFGRDHGSRRRDGRLVTACLVVIVLVTGMLYAPVVLAHGPGEFVEILTGSAPAQRPAETPRPTALVEVGVWLTRDLPLAVQGLILLAIATSAVLGKPTALRSRQFAVFSGLLVAILVAVPAVRPPERTWTFAVAPLLLLAGCGLEVWSRRLPFTGRGRVFIAALVFVAVGAAGFRVVSSETIRSSDQTGRFPEAKELVELISDQVRDREPVVAITPASAPIVYYGRRTGLSEVHFMLPGQGQTDDDSALVVVSQLQSQTPGEVLAALGLTNLFDPDHAELVGELTTASVYRLPARRVAAARDTGSR